jgi:septal ring factor EnvC (AmiA/AmiB activator)
MFVRTRKWQIVGLLLLANLLVGLEGQSRDSHHPVTAHEGQRARTALRHQLDSLHLAETELHQKRATIERQIETIKHQISELERALRTIESVVHR